MHQKSQQLRILQCIKNPYTEESKTGTKKENIILNTAMNFAYNIMAFYFIL